MVVKITKKLESLLAKVGIRKLFTILILIFGVLILSVFVVSRYKTIYSTIYRERIDKLRYVARFALEILKDESYYVKHNVKSLKKAQSETIGVLKDVRFEQADYIWIANYNGKMIYHPMKGLIGSDVRNYTDIYNYNFGKDLIQLPKERGSAYVSYYWPEIGQPKDKTFPKVTYVVAFKDWGWIIGTGVYIDDIQAKVLKTMIDGSGSIILVSILILLFFRYIVWATVITPVEELAEKSLKLANNDTTVTVSSGNEDTEFGKLYSAFNKFVEVFKTNQKNEKKLSLILNNISDTIIILNHKGIINAANPAIEKMFGYKDDQIEGMSINSLISPVLFPDDSPLKKEFSSGKYEVLGIKKDETFFDIEVNINEFLFNDEKIFILLIRDITEQKEVEKMKNEFVSMVSHELRTPLTSIRGSLGLLVSGVFPEIAGKVKDLLEIAHNNCIRLIDLINDILDIEKIAAGKMEFNMEKTNVSEIIVNAIRLNDAYADKFHVRYRFSDSVVSDVFINVDKSRLSQILTNLLSNAAKFSPEGDEVLIILERIDSKIKITIKDNGPGIPDEFKDKIFDKFTQVDSSNVRQKGGTGLGLSICKNMAENMNGAIGFESEAGHGTAFWVEFPLI